MKNYIGLFSLKGKNIYVLGGLGAIGLSVSKALAGSGAKVIVLDIDETKSKSLLGWAKKNKYKLHFEYFDAANLEACEEVMQRLRKKHGPIHGLVNVSYPRSWDWARPMEKMTIDYLRENVDKQLNSFIWTSRLVGMMMKKDGIKGSIINFGSIYGVVTQDLTIYEGTAMTGEIIYSAVKGGILNMTRFLASHFGKEGIRANCLCPGGVFEHQDPKFVKAYERKTLLGRMAHADEIASAVVFLAGDASSYITGSSFMVDGGWTAI